MSNIYIFFVWKVCEFNIYISQIGQWPIRYKVSKYNDLHDTKLKVYGFIRHFLKFGRHKIES